MSCVVVPLQPVPSQEVSVTLAGQPFALNVYSRGDSVYMDVILAGVTVLAGVLCLQGVYVLRNTYLTGVTGDFAWIDTQGILDPAYAGIGTRWLLGFYQ